MRRSRRSMVQSLSASPTLSASCRGCRRPTREECASCPYCRMADPCLPEDRGWRSVVPYVIGVPLIAALWIFVFHGVQYLLGD